MTVSFLPPFIRRYFIRVSRSFHKLLRSALHKTNALLIVPKYTHSTCVPTVAVDMLATHGSVMLTGFPSESLSNGLCTMSFIPFPCLPVTTARKPCNPFAIISSVFFCRKFVHRFSANCSIALFSEIISSLRLCQRPRLHRHFRIIRNTRALYCHRLISGKRDRETLYQMPLRRAPRLVRANDLNKAVFF